MSYQYSMVYMHTLKGDTICGTSFALCCCHNNNEENEGVQGIMYGTYSYQVILFYDLQICLFLCILNTHAQ